MPVTKRPSEARPRRSATQGRAAPPAQPTLPQWDPALVDPAHDQGVAASRCCGLDEVGRGALAGPLVAAAVVLPPDMLARLGPLAPFLRDSKTVPAARREDVAALVRAHAPVVALAVIPVDQINARGIGWANREAFRQLIARVGADAVAAALVDEYIVDGRIRPLAHGPHGTLVRCLVRADAQVSAVAAASLVAKVHRDTLMRALHARHPQYAWASNAGYGTAAHLAALRTHGATDDHREQFVRTALGRMAPRAAPAHSPDTPA